MIQITNVARIAGGQLILLVGGFIIYPSSGKTEARTGNDVLYQYLLFSMQV